MTQKNQMTFSDEDFSPVQLERRSAAISPILKDCLAAIDDIENKKLKLTLRKQINDCLVGAYNAGFIDSQNETKDTFRLYD